MSRRWFPTLHVLRGLAALGVCLAHVMGFFPHSPVIGTFMLGQTGVQLFFVLSGFLMAHVYRAHFGDAGAVGPFLRARWARTLVPYWAALPLAALTFPEFQWPIGGGPVSLETTLKAVLVFDQQTAPILTAAWTLSYEWGFYLAFAAVALLFGRRAWWMFAGAWTLVIALAYPWDGRWTPRLAEAAWFAFFLGMLAEELASRLRPPRHAGWLLAALVGVGLLLAHPQAPAWRGDIAWPAPFAVLVLAAALYDRARAPTFRGSRRAGATGPMRSISPTSR